MKNRIRKIIIFLLISSGLLVMAYPWISARLNQKNASKIIDGYEKGLKDCSEEKKKEMLEAARKYNRKILDSNVIMTDPFDEEAQRVTTREYEQMLDVDGSGMMGYLEIDKINVHLPIRHGVSQKVLEENVGHLQETSLPINGRGVHSVLSAHTGITKAKLFSDLDKIQVGDSFQLQVLGERLTYKVFNIEIVEPEEVSSLAIDKNKNLCTLITCTPYGINTHRLLVHGMKVKNKQEKETKKRKKAYRKILIIIAFASLVGGISICLYPYGCRKKQKREVEQRIREYDRMAADTNLDTLREMMEQYNRRLYEEGQSGLKDAWSYQKSSFNLRDWGLQSNMIGYLEIPGIKVILPIYLGANKENMIHGAAHLSQTSLPIGGNNTNCVIAAHRGYAKAAMFRDLDKLKPGEKIYVTNLWETRCYEVKKKKIIMPDETDQILIQEGKDMMTLITCHPYRHNYQRLLVYCEWKE